MQKFFPKFIKLFYSVSVLLIILMGCTKTSVEEKVEVTPSNQLSNIPTSTQTRPLAATRTPTPSPTIKSTIPEGDSIQDSMCKNPSDNYTLLEINGHKLNQRTYEMLQRAQSLYDGVIDITGDAITQGSYTNAIEASFSSHAGGGAIDLSVMSPGTYTILYEEIEDLISALRMAGFAAWYRDLDELYDGSPAHIHAIAIGDRTLSLAAREQLAGPFGYFWGYNGLPAEDKVPIRDPHGGPFVCEWMIEKGYPKKTATPSADENIP